MGPLRLLVLVCLSAAAIASMQPPPDENVIRISVELVQIDAVVTDPSGKLVSDLRPEEIEVRQDGKLQKITSFSLVRESKPAPASPVPGTAGAPRPKAAPPAPSRGLARTEVGRTIALIVDDLGLSFESTDSVKEALKSFVNKQMLPGDLVAVIRTSAGAGALQQFTSDKRLLLTAIGQIKYCFFSRTGLSSFAPIRDQRSAKEMMMSGNMPSIGGEDQSFESSVKEKVSGTGGPSGSGQDLTRQSERRTREFQQDYFAIGTLGAINYVVAGMKVLPGRKSALLFSESMPVLRTDWAAGRIIEELQRLADHANRAGVVLYTLDPRGLSTLGFTAADEIADDPRNSAVNRLTDMLRDRRTQYIESQNGLALLASETGGLFLSESNDIAGLVDRAASDMSAYYLIGYRPEDGTFNDDLRNRKYHRIHMKILRSGVKIRYRQGFLGVTEQEVAAAPANKQQQLIEALASPFRSGDIPLTLTCWFDRGNTTPGVVYSMIHIDGSKLEFTPEPDGRSRVTFDVVTSTFGDGGKISELSQRTIGIRLGAADLARIRQVGLLYSVAHPVKKSGAFLFRAVVRDGITGKLGSANQFIEVPDVSKGRLALSGILLASDAYTAPATADSGDGQMQNYSLGHPGVRRFLPGQKISYAYRIINPAPDSQSGGSKVETVTAIFRDGQQVFATEPRSLAPVSTSASRSINVGGALQLTRLFTPGDYTLQVAVRDRLAKPGRDVTTQFIDFQVLPAGAAP